jgi:hypothetical protein
MGLLAEAASAYQRAPRLAVSETEIDFIRADERVLALAS